MILSQEETKSVGAKEARRADLQQFGVICSEILRDALTKLQLAGWWKTLIGGRVDRDRAQAGTGVVRAGDRVEVIKDGNPYYRQIGWVREIRDRETYPVIIEFEGDTDSWWGLRRSAVRVLPLTSKPKQASPPEHSAKVSRISDSSGDDPRTEEAKLAFNQALAGLDGQRKDLLNFQGRAKDFVSLLTLATTFLGAFGKANVDGILDQLHHRPAWITWLFIGLPVLTLACALYLMLPRNRWLFVINAESITQNIARRLPDTVFADNAQLYLAYVGVLSRIINANTPPLRRRRYALWLAMFFLVGTIATVGILVLSGPTGGHK